MNAATRSIMLANRGQGRKSSSNDSRHRPWASLIPELLIQIFMQLGIINLCACAGVCKEWRSVNNYYKSTLLQNQTPLAIVKSKFPTKGCFLLNIFDGTKYKTLLPILASRWLMGISCGYLIMQGSDKNICLVNLITRDEISFPRLPIFRHYRRQAILFYSEKVSENLLLVLNRKIWEVLVSLSSRPEWHKVVVNGRCKGLVDMAYFNGNILVLTSDAKIGKLKLQYQTLNANCTTLIPEQQSLSFFDVKINIPPLFLSSIRLVPSGDQLFMVSHVRQTECTVIMVHKLDRAGMEWIQVNDLGEDALFLSEGSCSVVNPTKWGGRSNCIYILSKLCNEWDLYLLNAGYIFSRSPVILEKGSHLQPYFWYFPHQIDQKNKVHCPEEAMDF